MNLLDNTSSNEGSHKKIANHIYAIQLNEVMAATQCLS